MGFEFAQLKLIESRHTNWRDNLHNSQRLFGGWYLYTQVVLVNCANSTHITKRIYF